MHHRSSLSAKLIASSSGRGLFPQKLQQQLRNPLRLILLAEMSCILHNRQLGPGNGIPQLVRPIDNLPRIIRAPDDLYGYLTQLTQAVCNLHCVLGIVVADLMLKEANLADGAGDVGEVSVETGGLKGGGVVYGAEEPGAEVDGVGGRGGFGEGVETGGHLLPGAFGGVAVEADDVEHGEGADAGGGEDGEALGDAAANVVGDDVDAVEAPGRQEALEDGDLAGDGGVDGGGPGAFGDAVAEEVVEVDLVAGLDEAWEDGAPDEG